MPKIMIDYRFFVIADDVWQAARKLEEFLPDSTDDLWYTIRAVKECEKDGQSDTHG